ncbi:MAG: hypothetical protein M1401_18020 [Chloroflexi bacterium]|nr:hypothetical protein [Chloroflexota bacterium]MCL5110719.1 hypothetical protein [Chloroflexota bacterium]
MRKRFGILVVVVAAMLLSLVATTGVAAAQQAPASQGTWGPGCWGGGPGGAYGGAYVDPVALGPVAKVLNMTAQDLLAARNDGKSIFQIAADKGVSEQQVLDAALAPYRDMLALRVKYGSLTQEQADQMVQREQDWLRTVFSATDAVAPYGGWGCGMMGGYGNYGGWGCGGMGGYYNNPGTSGTANGSNYGGWGVMGRNGWGNSAGWGMGMMRGW